MAHAQSLSRRGAPWLTRTYTSRHCRPVIFRIGPPNDIRRELAISAKLFWNQVIHDVRRTWRQWRSARPGDPLLWNQTAANRQRAARAERNQLLRFTARSNVLAP